jgi:hypothetical protein
MFEVIRAGEFRHTSTGGETIDVDQPLSQERVDLLCGLIASKGLTPCDVTEIWLDGETFVLRCITPPINATTPPARGEGRNEG